MHRSAPFLCLAWIALLGCAGKTTSAGDPNVDAATDANIDSTPDAASDVDEPPLACDCTGDRCLSRMEQAERFCQTVYPENSATLVDYPGCDYSFLELTFHHGSANYTYDGDDELTAHFWGDSFFGSYETCGERRRCDDEPTRCVVCAGEYLSINDPPCPED
jgi:hypothetical protein